MYITFTNNQKHYSCFKAEFLRNFEIRVGTSDDITGLELCYHQSPQVPSGATVTYPCTTPLYGQFVSVQVLNGLEGLTLCEVQVFGFGRYKDNSLRNSLSIFLLLTFSKWFPIISEFSWFWRPALAACLTLCYILCYAMCVLPKLLMYWLLLFTILHIKIHSNTCIYTYIHTYIQIHPKFMHVYIERAHKRRPRDMFKDFFSFHIHFCTPRLTFFV